MHALTRSWLCRTFGRTCSQAKGPSAIRKKFDSIVQRGFAARCAGCFDDSRVWSWRHMVVEIDAHAVPVTTSSECRRVSGEVNGSSHHATVFLSIAQRAFATPTVCREAPSKPGCSFFEVASTRAVLRFQLRGNWHGVSECNRSPSCIRVESATHQSQQRSTPVSFWSGGMKCGNCLSLTVGPSGRWAKPANRRDVPIVHTEILM